jgi:hypothetical protein
VGLLVPSLAVATPGGNGRGIGQDPVRLALTRCSDAGVGNGDEVEGVIFNYTFHSDCLARYGFNTGNEIAALLITRTTADASI